MRIVLVFSREVFAVSVIAMPKLFKEYAHTTEALSHHKITRTY